MLLARDARSQFSDRPRAEMVIGDDAPVDLTTAHVQRAVNGNPGSVRWLVERFSPLLQAVAAHRLGAKLSASYDPADIVQDVWIAVLPKLGTLQLHGPRTTPTVLKYLTTAVVNRIRNLLEKHLTRRLANEPGDADLEDLEDPVSGIVTKAVRAEHAEGVRRALAQLDERDQEIVIRRGIEQQPLRVVAEHLGIEPGTAAVRFHRALKRLQQQLPHSLFADLGADLA